MKLVRLSDPWKFEQDVRVLHRQFVEHEHAPRSSPLGLLNWLSTEQGLRKVEAKLSLVEVLTFVRGIGRTLPGWSLDLPVLKGNLKTFRLLKYRWSMSAKRTGAGD